ncbi:Cys-Gln thioester bond-forming surface protein [Anaerotignum lactatifermentans]|uniref:Cys-Gln thioester bond-forming surface protein n=1 Tax=Anaerotignum lactatifermentans TaxID=160404 RepID=A0ABS2GAD9_9FIRM|nr:SpaA isopeptide-forming pilin-related protein [Anaerotignum lactatifermentans]MBM6829474.1 Cys-Gln thioester bond-forming surface protein [Anaerotignum lactatifermentans]MBM6877832.1 Cys-Gln thioester bond-forming surface protein [Anaerotignum lactatifermentans]MBM6951051.1 Cys-Gln thioester bond-forming surface protein [Anaerotignum lactatifermentans]
MSAWKKFTAFLMSAFLLLTTGVQAFAGTSMEDALNKVNLYVKQDKGAQLLTWKGIIDSNNFAPAVIVYQAEDGKEYPAFCANPNRPGVEDLAGKSYDVDVDQLDTDPAVWGVITNGYPYKTPQEMGVNTEYEAYYATKMAVWAVVHDNYSNLDDWKANGSQNAHVEKAMKDLVAKGRANQYVYKSWLAINPKNQTVDTDDKDENYLSQEYTLKSNVNIRSYRVVLDGDVPEGTIVTDVNNTPKDSFEGTETTFKALIPKDTAENSGSFRVLVKGKLENKSVLFGISHDANKQDYYVAPLPSYNGDSWVDLTYSTTGTVVPGEPDDPENPQVPEPSPGLQILKVKKGTTEGLAGAVFKVEIDGKTIGHYVTDENGEILIPDLTGTVSVTEEVPPVGYVLDEENHKDVEIVDADEPTVVTFANEEMAQLEITKVDADTGETLAGATIRVALDDGSDSWDVYTNASGKATLTNMKSGTYTITEIVAPEGYLLNEEPVLIKLEPGKTATVTLKDKAKPGIVIKKYDEDTGFPLENAEFSVAKKGGSIVYEGMTDKEGKIKVEGLEEGWYTITEIAPPKGYLISTESKDVYLEGGKCVEVKFDNRLRPSLQIMKIDAETGEPLAGAKFKVQKTEDKTVSEYVTDETGTVVIHDLDEAVYTVEEIEAPDGYAIDPDSHKDIALEWGKTKTLVFSDTRKPALEIIKVDAKTEEPLANAKFKITKTEDDTVSEYMTDENGKITIQDLPEGIYTVEEITAPDGYILDTQHKEIELSAGDSKQLIYENTRKPDLIITKINVLTEKPVPNTTFKIEYEGENGGVVPLGTYKTDETGQIILEDVEVGWYIITETRPAQGMSLPSNPVTRKYLAPGENAYLTAGSVDSQTPSLGTGNTASQSKVTVTSGNDYIGEEIPNYPLNSLVIKKTDGITSEMLEGAAFEVRKVSEDISGNSGTIIGRYTTDSSGIIVITGLEAGAYLIEEVQAPANYLISENSKQQAWLKADGTSVVEVTFANYPYGSLLITKVDALTNKPLSNATFQVTTGDGTVVGNSNGMYTTNSDGEILIPNLKPGSYVVTERIAPEGYACDTKPQTIEIGTDGATYKVQFQNQPMCSLVILKKDADNGNPLSGAQFKVTTSKGTVVGTNNGIFTTDSNGSITIPNLEKGSYIVEEVKAPEGYVLEEQSKTIEIDFGKTYTLEFTNKKMTSLVVKKVDSVTGEPLVGAKFLVEKQNGEHVGEYTTDSTGTILLPTLDPDWYVVRETKAPDGYILDETPKTVEVKTNVPTVVTFENKPLSGIKIVKADSETGEPLEGVSFAVSKMNGEKIGTFKTDQEGMIYISDLEDGYYTVTETEGLEGYHWDKEPKTVEVKSGKQTIVEVENQPYSGLVIEKTDSRTGDPIEGVEFLVTKFNGEQIGYYETDESGLIVIEGLEEGTYLVKETKEAKGYKLGSEAKEVEIKDGKRTTLKVENDPMSSVLIHKIDSVTGEGIPGVKFLLYDSDNEPIGQFETDDEGYIWIRKELPEGKYKLRELEPAEGYISDDSEKTFYVQKGRTTEIEWENTPEVGQIVITKRSAEFNELTGLPAGSPLSGAVFEIYNTTGNLVDKISSGSNGVAASKGLPVGVYTIKEVSAPRYYALNDKTLLAEIRHNGDIVRFEVLNSSISLNLTIQKKGANAAFPGQTIQYDIYEVQNGSSGTLENFYIHDRIPTDATRALKIVTGTYSERMYYKITYKTNYRDYRVLAENLLTKNSYEYSLHPNVLGLANGEYVTDVRLEFPKASPGFKMLENMSVFCQVMPNMPKEYRIVNRADVGGRYGNEWESAKTSWNTTVWTVNTPPVTLPKTGY